MCVCVRVRACVCVWGGGGREGNELDEMGNIPSGAIFRASSSAKATRILCSCTLTASLG